MTYSKKDIKIIKGFSQSLFNEMLVIRHGITVCCDIDPDKAWVNAELLALKGIYDPEACLCQNDVCDEDCDCCAAPTIIINESCLPATGPTGTVTLNPINTGCYC